MSDPASGNNGHGNERTEVSGRGRAKLRIGGLLQAPLAQFLVCFCWLPRAARRQASPPAEFRQEEIEKHNLILGQVQRFIRRKGQARSKRQIVYRVRQRLRAIAVGTGSVGNGPMPPAFSWTQGFRLLAKHSSLSGQLRNLDRHRVACVAALRRRLKRKGTSAGSKKPVRALKFEGFPFSYAGLAERRRNPSRGGDADSTPGVES